MITVRQWLTQNQGQIRFQDIGGQRWYATVDIAALLGYRHPAKAFRRMLERNQDRFEGKTRIIKTIHSSGLPRTNLALSEEGVELFLYRAETALGREIWGNIVPSFIVLPEGQSDAAVIQ